MRDDVAENWRWANGYEDQAREIVAAHLAKRILRFKRSSRFQDMRQATDLVAVLEGGGDVALRMRRESCDYRDFTVRAWLASGAETEIDKLLKGHCYWYLYGWVYGHK